MGLWEVEPAEPGPRPPKPEGGWAPPSIRAGAAARDSPAVADRFGAADHTFRRRKAPGRVRSVGATCRRSGPVMRVALVAERARASVPTEMVQLVACGRQLCPVDHLTYAGDAASQSTTVMASSCVSAGSN